MLRRQDSWGEEQEQRDQKPCFQITAVGVALIVTIVRDFVKGIYLEKNTKMGDKVGDKYSPIIIKFIIIIQNNIINLY